MARQHMNLLPWRLRRVQRLIKRVLLLLWMTLFVAAMTGVAYYFVLSDAVTQLQLHTDTNDTLQKDITALQHKQQRVDKDMAYMAAMQTKNDLLLSVTHSLMTTAQQYLDSLSVDTTQATLRFSVPMSVPNRAALLTEIVALVRASTMLTDVVLDTVLQHDFGYTGVIRGRLVTDVMQSWQ